MEDQYYKARFKFNPNRRNIWAEIANYHQKIVPDNATVLDLGAGYCDFINLIKASKKYAEDISPETPHYLEKDVEFLHTPAWELSSIPSNSVDIVHESNLFEHFNDEELDKTIKEIKRVLKVGGKLILMQPNYRLAYKHYFDDYTHKKVWSDVSLPDFLVAHDMKVIVRMPRFLPFSMKSDSRFIPRFLIPFMVRMYLKSPFKPFAGQMMFVAEK